MMRKLFLWCLLLLAPAIWSAEAAAAEAADVFGDRMVLQRDKPAPVWGTAEPGETVTVDFAGQNKTATANTDGKWQAWAGSIIQEWIPRHGFRLEPELKELADKVDAYYPNTPHDRVVWKQCLAEVERWHAEAEKAMAENKPFPYPQPLMPEPGPRDLCGFYNGKIHPIVPMATAARSRSTGCNSSAAATTAARSFVRSS